MFTRQEYELLDFGRGRKLERFGEYVLDREAPAAGDAPPSSAALWRHADARFQRRGDGGRWETQNELPRRWPVTHGSVQFELKRTDFGHVGLFAEQAANWDWLSRQSSDLKVLNLFAYTGGSTLAAAAAGAAEVVHVDSARNTVNWARRNAELSGLAAAPIRWITEDSQKFVRRELKRGNRYDGVVLDPPSFGHGTKSEVWTLTRDLPELLAGCGELVDSRRGFILLTCHTTDLGADALAATLRESLPEAGAGVITTNAMVLVTADRRRLESGVVVRWTAQQ
jgi:23S rRNA (cytosine1962-C5)-methyltransferase